MDGRGATSPDSSGGETLNQAPAEIKTSAGKSGVRARNDMGSGLFAANLYVGIANRGRRPTLSRGRFHRRRLSSGRLRSKTPTQRALGLGNVGTGNEREAIGGGFGLASRLPRGRKAFPRSNSRCPALTDAGT